MPMPTKETKSPNLACSATMASSSSARASSKSVRKIARRCRRPVFDEARAVDSATCSAAAMPTESVVPPMGSSASTLASSAGRSRRPTDSRGWSTWPKSVKLATPRRSSSRKLPSAARTASFANCNRVPGAPSGCGPPTAGGCGTLTRAFLENSTEQFMEPDVSNTNTKSKGVVSRGVTSWHDRRKQPSHKSWGRGWGLLLLPADACSASWLSAQPQCTARETSAGSSGRPAGKECWLKTP
mmetsp:Transcript_106137/g.310268  ORF Transcript_106137/g.310268 Transcript_106137/m.310268 type:complete len:241 (+) Transcript_106137:896-1618(+)